MFCHWVETPVNRLGSHVFRYTPSMELARNLLLLLHLAGMAGILISLLASRTKISAGITHSALLALVAGISLVGVRYALHSQNPTQWPLIDNAKIGIKLIVVLAILILAYRGKKKEAASNIWNWIAALTITNIIVAVVW